MQVIVPQWHILKPWSAVSNLWPMESAEAQRLNSCHPHVNQSPSETCLPFIFLYLSFKAAILSLLIKSPSCTMNTVPLLLLPFLRHHIFHTTQILSRFVIRQEKWGNLRRRVHAALVNLIVSYQQSCALHLYYTLEFLWTAFCSQITSVGPPYAQPKAESSQ